MDCGPTCLRMISKHYGRHFNADSIRQKAGFNKSGVTLLGISETAEKMGFRTRGVQINFTKLLTAPLPAILHWNQNHFVVLVSLTEKKAMIADPARSIITYNTEEFKKFWFSTQTHESGQVGTALLLEPGMAFFDSEGEKEHKLSWEIISGYLRQSKFQLVQVFISLLVTSILQLILPFLTQSIVDTGINTRNMQYITIVLFAQLMLTFSSTVIEFIRSRLQLRISNRINISILSDFWIKLTRLPVSYFDRHQVGDTLQRIDDNRKIQSFLTSQTLTTLFAIFNFFVYSIILMLYSIQLLSIFIVGSIIYFMWIRLFLKVRRKINYQMFHVASRENNATLQLVQGMQDIRLNNAEKLKRWEWENLQVSVFKLNFKNLNFTQWQTTGALFINQAKDILITFIVAKLVVEGQLTFGTMLAVQYILGQLNGPVSQLIELSQNIQDAKISLERLNEIHEMDDEEPKNNDLLTYLPENKSIIIKKLWFTYPGAGNDPVISDLDLMIPEGKVTAIVGMSGSGKTTLLKLLLKISEHYEGEIRIGENNFKYISPSFWRSQCGAVLQGGYIFNDSIARNIAVGDEIIDHERLITSCNTANILSFIEALPNGFNTRLGAEGVGVSEGQRQRILIARAIYKDPQYLFFDEATNSLDANNEKAIVNQLSQFFKGRTVVIVAHRLSTVKDADKIVVLNEGKIEEEGSHHYLTSLKGRYYELVKNQLELGL
ncbi:bacteriocin-processing peptidase. Cysteine peptidase. MEROPS family C39 [Mucilaginibacter gossypiicola]|uniref:Bacteriocin-processing peptidase. Cysteine peptidase. MEROPS family C39 n=2 Tax=Mucilaginibacter gossypiicola TaxID=551995 RepID=A0A1H8BB78_9SPHI|nr:bacteriocin-processing peptidase. Cysteine peptidase. MEROPS family C39 [Mucilaginibacter gossypiicola]